jgi:hypothetical protein
MSGEGNTDRPLVSIILLGVVDFVCVLKAADLYTDRRYVAGTCWLIAGVAFSVIGYYWSKIKQGAGRPAHCKRALATEKTDVRTEL